MLRQFKKVSQAAWSAFLQNFEILLRAKFWFYGTDIWEAFCVYYLNQTKYILFFNFIYDNKI